MDINTFASRYAALWNEPDPAVRRETIVELWADDGTQFTGENEYRGHSALAARVTAAYEEFVATGGFVFVPVGIPASHHDALKFTVHMVAALGGDPAWIGTMFVLFDADGRIQRDYQF
jgi:uncharacterized protein